MVPKEAVQDFSGNKKLLSLISNKLQAMVTLTNLKFSDLLLDNLGGRFYEQICFPEEDR